MPDIKISEYDAAAALDGSELVEVVQDGGNVQTTTGAIAALGAGDYQRLAEVLVVSPTTDIDFTGLDLDADKFYRLEVVAVPDSTGSHFVSLFYNADYTATNYDRQQTNSVGSVVSASGGNDAIIYFTNSIPDTTSDMCFSVDIRKAATGRKASASSNGTGIHSTGVPFVETFGHRWSSTANVTGIKLRNSITNGFGAGTLARLYRID